MNDDMYLVMQISKGIASVRHDVGTGLDRSRKPVDWPMVKKKDLGGG